MNGYVEFLIVAAFIVGAVTFYNHFEGWSIIDCLFFIVSSITTVGKQ